MSGARRDRPTRHGNRASADGRRAEVSAAGLRHRVLARRLLTLTQFVLPAGDRAVHGALRARSAPVAPSRDQATPGIGSFGHVDLLNGSERSTLRRRPRPGKRPQRAAARRHRLKATPPGRRRRQAICRAWARCRLVSDIGADRSERADDPQVHFPDQVSVEEWVHEREPNRVRRIPRGIEADCC